VVGVILNLAIWFAWHALRPEGGGIDYFTAVVALGSWIAMEKCKIGVIPTLAACAVLGVVGKMALSFF
jgi:chromate transporter